MSDSKNTQSAFENALKLLKDNNLNEALANNLNIPLIASGGAGELNHLIDAIKVGKADAVLAASIFHYKEISIQKVKEALKREGLQVRL